MSEDPRKLVVRSGYDAIADRYLEWGARVEGDPRERFVNDLLRLLPPGARVLDLGCGAAVPSTRALAACCEVTGVDISSEQIARARRNVPEATFVQADLCNFDVAAGSVDAVTSFYALGHVPREEHAQLLARIYEWLAPGGFFLSTLGVEGGEDCVDEWLGVPMFFSGYPAVRNRELLRAAGFELVLDDVVPMREPGYGESSFLWVLAQKPRT